MHKSIITSLLLLTSLPSMAQSLEKMNWFNEPAQWSVTDGTLAMQVTPNTDYWRISHYGFTVDDAPFSMPSTAASSRPN